MAEHESDKSRFVYTINGVKVVFPCKAYPTQLSMMNMIIKGIERRQNSLLESPTGSGKSLALLCSCLAWQSAEYEKKEKLEREENAAEALEANGCCDDACGAEELSPQTVTGFQMNSKSEYFQHDTSETAKNSTELHKSDNNTEKVFSPPQSSDESESHVGNFASGSLSDDDFQPTKKRLRTPGNQVAPSKKRRVQTSLESSSCEDESNSDPPETTTDTTAGENISPDSKDSLENKEKCCTDSGDKIKSAKIKVPKIFFGTRTHKQIAQISRELRKTEYKKVRMTILSSREHSCVHPTVSKGKNKNEECRILLDGKAGPGTTCKYYQKVNTIKTQTSLKYHGLIEAWDVEDLVTLGNRIRACPYYAARELMKEADIIFCPYNYLIDPKIRMQMEINLRDQLVVLDEAHNVEDSARDAASLTLTAVDLQNVLEDLDKLVQKQVLTENHRALHVMTGSFLRWIHESSSQLKERGFEQSSKVWSGMEIIEVMEKQGITSGTFLLYFEHFQFVMTSAKDPKRQGMPSLSTHSSTLLEGIFLIGKYMMGYNMKYILDYRCAVLQTSVMVRNTQVMPGGWRRSHGGMRKEWTHSLNFWCLNPAVVFSELGSEARCIILTSGTLSPMTSFSSELGVKFPIHLEANHVVASSQVWVGTLASGPSGSAVNASYQSSETFTFQDEVGKAVLNICETVPHGVLCFFPSYNMLDKLSKRWQVTGLWSKLLDKKKIVSEPRGGDKLEFDDIMHQFYDAVRTSEDEECTDSDSDVESSVDGGLFLAVCRGKVSEGLDFADNNARAVITIGIPFPNVKDIQVELKRKYNTQYSASRGLLTGSEWYEIQAYRALNQALGRCIRHKRDWGAILLIDERFNKSSKYTNGISKWVRKRIIKYDDFGEAMTSLKQFTTARKLDPCPTPVVASQSLLCASFLETPTKETNFNFDRNLSTDSTPLSKVPRTHDAGFTPGHSVNGDLLKRAGADTPAKPINIHTDAKSSQESSSLCKIQISESSLPVLTLQSSANAERLDEITEIRVVKQEGNANSSVKVEQSAYTDAMRIQQPQLIEVPDNQSGIAPHSPRIDIICADGTPKNQKFVSSHRKSLEQGTQERKVFNGRTLVLDCSQKNGLSLGKGKFRKPLKPHENRESTVSNCTKTKNSGGEGFLEEQCCSSPELFATPSTSPLSSSSKQGDSELAISESADRTCVKLESTNLACREPSKIESTENQAINAGRDSDNYEGEDTEKSERLVKQDMVETSVTTDTNSETVPPERNLNFRSKVTLSSNALQQRDFLDDVNDDFAVKGSEIKIECDPTPLEVSSKRVERSCGSASKESSKEPRNRRRSMRLRKKSNTARTSSKTREENNEVEGDRAFLFCTQCGAGLVKGSVTPKPIPKDTPDVILQAVGGERILIIDREDSEVLNLCPWFATDKINSTGLKLNSLFVPKTDTCYIPQVCRRCHSTSKDSPMVGFEFVSFGSSSLIKQIWLFPSVVYVGNH